MNLSRRSLLQSIGFASAASLWNPVASAAESLKKQGKACILLWMQGAPSQFETFSPKPGHKNGGETKAIKTNVSGIEISEHLPETAKVADKLCFLRSVTSKEGSHPRGTYLLHTGYVPAGGVKFPTIGSMVAREKSPPEFELPSFVRIGNGRLGDGAGFIGTQYDPFLLPKAGSLPENSAIAGTPDRFNRRLKFLGDLEADYAAKGGADAVRDHRHLYERAAKMIQSPQMKTFDLSNESSAVKEEYGSGDFAQGCLLARRLVETGVSFVEVVAGNWDTHDDNFNRTKRLCGEIDRPYSALLRDLERRGMLDSTLVVWMGEFGRTPRINARSGRDHFSKAFNGVLAGCGVHGGQVIGKTDAGGDEITDRPVQVPDLFRTIYHALGVNADRENMSNVGRPIKVVDGGEVVQEVFG